ncbi:MAG: DUF72 domain-containing protein [Proteobacteria bacterium]|nr:DUF72 domain-containing protein [Pseudomonadota bacterium]
MSNKFHIGTSGWQYWHWKGIFYPENLSSSKFFDFYTKFFDTTEINATFYRDVRDSTFVKWFIGSPEKFIYSVKLNRTITHYKRLKVDNTTIENYLKKISLLKEKLGVILIQLPPSLKYDRGVVEDFISVLDKNFRYTIEVRNRSFISDNFFEILSKNNIAFCIADSAGRYPYYEAITADFIYLRLHGHESLYASKYTEEQLKGYAEKISKWDKETFVYFDNDFSGYAVTNALFLKKLLE